MQRKLLKLFCLATLINISSVAYSIPNPMPGNSSEPQIGASNQQIKQVKNIFYNVPSPIEVTNILKEMNLSYSPDLMNPTSNSENYLTQSEMAINMGVYGADLSYIRIYEQFQDAAHYLAVIKRFTRELGIPEEHEQQAAQRIQENIENRDSLVHIISETYTNSDSYLKENQRGGTAALIVFGGWVETLYLATNIMDLNNPNPDLADLIVQQKHSIKNLIGLLSQYSGDTKIDQLLPDLKILEQKFNHIQSKRDANTKVEHHQGKTLIRNKVKHQFTPEQLKEIRDQNNILRERVIKI